MASFFPPELATDLEAVFRVLPQKTFSDYPDLFSEDGTEYVLTGGTITIPYRCYLLEPPESDIAKLPPLQQQILFCLYTRSCEGYLREKYVQKILSSDFEEWCIPYIVKLCDEYVVEILQVVYDSLRKKPNEKIKAFCTANKDTICKCFSRMISYWNEYYRADCFHIEEYVGWKLFREYLGYGG